MCLDWKEECKLFDYVFQGPIRIVPPYTFTHRSNAKGRWVGRTMPDVFAEEFPHYGNGADAREYFRVAFEEGRLGLTGLEGVVAGHIISPTDHIQHTVTPLESTQG